LHFVTTKHLLAPALNSDVPSYEKLRLSFWERIHCALSRLLAAAAAGIIRPDVDADDVLGAVASLCMPAHDERPGYSQCMVGVLVDGPRRGATPSTRALRSPRSR
jgi:hypothetical protein